MTYITSDGSSAYHRDEYCEKFQEGQHGSAKVPGYQVHPPRPATADDMRSLRPCRVCLGGVEER